MLFRYRLERAVQSLPLRDKEEIRIVDTDPLRYLLDVVSADFEGMDERERQHLVRNHLRQTFSLDELGQHIEFIATDSRSEREVPQ